MTTDYRLDLYDSDGDLDSKLTDFTGLSYIKAVNRPGLLQFQLWGDHPVLGRIEDKWVVEAWRKPDGGNWGMDFVGLVRDSSWSYTDIPKAVITCPGIMEMLGWRHVLYYAGQTNLTKFLASPAETIMKTLVDYNAAANATTGNGRLRNGAITGLSIQADSAAGNVLDYYCSWENLLETLQALSEIGGGDFDLVQTAVGAYEFRFYSGQLGTDRRTTVLFSMERGNMSNPAFVSKRSTERTVALVAGQGDEDLRETVIRTGSNYSATNDIEMFVDARDIEFGQTDALQDRGDVKLEEVRAKEAFAFDVLQIQSCQYGVDYYLGDLVKAINPFGQALIDQKFESVIVGFNPDGKETIKILMREP